MTGAGAGLEAVDHEWIEVFTGDDCVCCLDNGIGADVVQPAGGTVGDGGGTLDARVGNDEVAVGPAPRNREIVTARAVWIPYQASAGTGYSPKLSFSVRNFLLTEGSKSKNADYR